MTILVAVCASAPLDGYQCSGTGSGQATEGGGSSLLFVPFPDVSYMQDHEGSAAAARAVYDTAMSHWWQFMVLALLTIPGSCILLAADWNHDELDKADAEDRLQAAVFHDDPTAAAFEDASSLPNALVALSVLETLAKALRYRTEELANPRPQQVRGPGGKLHRHPASPSVGAEDPASAYKNQTPRDEQLAAVRSVHQDLSMRVRAVLQAEQHHARIQAAAPTAAAHAMDQTISDSSHATALEPNISLRSEAVEVRSVLYRLAEIEAHCSENRTRLLEHYQIMDELPTWTQRLLYRFTVVYEDLGLPRTRWNRTPSLTMNLILEPVVFGLLLITSVYSAHHLYFHVHDVVLQESMALCAAIAFAAYILVMVPGLLFFQVGARALATQTFHSKVLRYLHTERKRAPEQAETPVDKVLDLGDLELMDVHEFRHDNLMASAPAVADMQEFRHENPMASPRPILPTQPPRTPPLELRRMASALQASRPPPRGASRSPVRDLHGPSLGGHIQAHNSYHPRGAQRTTSSFFQHQGARPPPPLPTAASQPTHAWPTMRSNRSPSPQQSRTVHSPSPYGARAQGTEGNQGQARMLQDSWRNLAFQPPVAGVPRANMRQAGALPPPVSAPPPVSVPPQRLAPGRLELVQVPHGQEQLPVSHGNDRRAARSDYGKGPILASALHENEADQPGDLEFSPGDTIRVFRIPQQNGWWHGENTRTGKVGDFPSNYVRLLQGEGGEMGAHL